ncbi:MAG: hypothetical protein M0009_14075 [Deltaproteobacteria bacterium]|nr:hypothetical protein [Deltaproteobacteria bacterium]
MARTKFTFEKRQKEIARQQKQKDKAARRAEAKLHGSSDPELAGDDRDAFPDAPDEASGECVPPESQEKES